MTVEELLKKYKRKYPGVPYEPAFSIGIVSNKNGKEHSYGDAPSIIFTNKDKVWHKNGKIHREGDKPAVVYRIGVKKWYKEGELHRENDKPAVVYPNGRKEYWFNGVKYLPNPKEQINKLTPKKSDKQKQREDLLKEFVIEMLGM